MREASLTSLSVTASLLRVTTLCTFEFENSALAVELILLARSQGGIGLTRCVDDWFTPASMLVFCSSMLSTSPFFDQCADVETVVPAPSHNIVDFCVRELGTRSGAYHGGALTGVCEAQTWLG